MYVHNSRPRRLSHNRGQDMQPRPFNHIRCKGVGGSVHLMYSNERKLGGARTHPKRHHPVRLFSMTHHPQTLPLQHENDVSATTPHPQHNGMTHFLGGWSNTTSTQSPTLHMQTGSPPAGHCPQLHLGPQTDGLGLGWARVRV